MGLIYETLFSLLQSNLQLVDTIEIRLSPEICPLFKDVRCLECSLIGDSSVYLESCYEVKINRSNFFVKGNIEAVSAGRIQQFLEYEYHV